MKKIKVFIAILIAAFMFINCTSVMAQDFTVTYKGATLPLITDNNQHLAYQLHTNSSKLFSYNWNMRNTNLTTSYYVFGGIDRVENNQNVKKWINTSYGSLTPVRGGPEGAEEFLIGWNTGFIYNNHDYVVPTDANNYRNAVTIPGNVEENIGLVIKHEFKFRNDGQLLEVIYHVKNTSNSTKEFLLWSGGDTELANDDGCTVGTLNKEKARGFYLYSTHTAPDQYPDALNVQMPIFATDTKVKFWYTDLWSDIRDIYDTSVEPENKYAKSLTELFTKGPSVNDNPQDTAALWYWDNQSLDAGEEKVYSVLIGITNFSDDVENNIARVIEDANIEIEQDTYQFTFNIDHIKDGGTIPPQTIDSRGKATRPEDPIHDGNMIFDDWYADPEHTIKFDFENTIITHDTVIYGNWKLPPGEIKVTDPINEPDVIAEILTPIDDITEAIDLTDEELEKKEAGKNISIYVEINDISDELSDNDKALIEEKLDNKTEIGTYLDIGLFKKLDEEDPTRIPKSKEPFKLSIEIPDDLKNTDPNVKRTYQLVRIEDGELITIDLELEDGKLVFETDEFTTYALTYKDKRIISLVPDTIDGVIIYAIIFTLSIMVIRSICKNIKKLKGAN